MLQTGGGAEPKLEKATTSENANVMDLTMFDEHSLAQASLHLMASGAMKIAAAGAAAAALAQQHHSFTIMVNGIGSGKNDVGALIEHVLPTIRSVAPDMPIHILCNDLLANEWMVLMNQLEELRGARPDELKNVYCKCVSGNCRHRLTIPDSVHLCVSFSVLHYPQTLPFDLDEKIRGAMAYISLPRGGPREALEQTMDSYLYDYARARMEELVAGGALVCAMDGETAEQNHQFAKLYTPLERGVVSMIEDELLPPSLRTTFFIMTASFSEARCRAVLQRLPLLEDMSTSLLYVPCPYYLKWQDGNISDAEFASEVGNAILACFKMRLKECCVPQHMDDKVFEERMSELLSRIEAMCATDPAGNDTSGITCFLHWRKPLR